MAAFASERDHRSVTEVLARNAPQTAELEALLLRAARFEVARRGAGLPGDELEAIARASASAALTSVLPRLEAGGPDPPSTAWVAKFAIVAAAMRMRERLWQEKAPVESPIEEPALARLLGDEETAALVASLIHRLSPDERRVLRTLVLDQVPIDVFAGRHGTSRAAVYSRLRAARSALAAALLASPASAAAFAASPEAGGGGSADAPSG
jgi:RNA polymerase sigma-70 factor (ECF subfamily)